MGNREWGKGTFYLMAISEGLFVNIFAIEFK